jgi:hypothetical protein
MGEYLTRTAAAIIPKLRRSQAILTVHIYHKMKAIILVFNPWWVSMVIEWKW